MEKCVPTVRFNINTLVCCMLFLMNLYSWGWFPSTRYTFSGWSCACQHLQQEHVNTCSYLWAVSQSALWIPGSECRTDYSCHVILQHVCSPQSSSRYCVTSIGETNRFSGKWVNRNIFAQTGSVLQLQLQNPLRRQGLSFINWLPSQELLTHFRTTHLL